jgi:hypothetical protein
MSSSTTTGEAPTEGGQRLIHRWPPLNGLAWNICILFSANDAYLRDLARTASGRPEDGYPPERMHTTVEPGTTPSSGLDLEGSASGRSPR